MTIAAYGYDEDGQLGGWSGRDVPSVSYRYGYQIGSSKPRFVKQETQRDVAQLAAREEAKRVRAKLEELGAPAEVSWWIQRITAQTAITFEEPVIEAV